MRTILLLALCSAVVSLGCALDSEGQAQPGSPGGSGGADAAATGGTGGSGTGGSGGTSPVDASWPGDAAAGTGGGQPEDAAGDVTLDAKPDVVAEAGFESDCTNGLDDDADGLPDCADPDCAVIVTCVPAAPPGWTGPSFVRARATADAVTDCGSMTQGDTFYQGLMAGGHTCNCTCGGPSGGTCGNSSASVYSSTDCTGSSYASLSGTGCFTLSASTGTAAIKSVIATVPPLLAPPICTPYASANVGELSWNQALDMCEPAPSTGCEAGEACVPLPPAELEQAACILRLGDQACPPAFGSKRTFFEGAEDDRDCSASGCACATAAGAKCGGKVRVHGNDDCSFAVGSFDLDGNCHAVTTTNKVSSLDLAPDGPHGGQCASSGTGTPTGTASPTGTHTLCCSPGL